MTGLKRLVCSLVLLVLAVPIPAVQADPEPTTLTYEVNPSALRAQFVEEGRIPITLPVRGEVVARVADTGIFASTTVGSDESAGGRSLRGQALTSLPLEGVVEGEPQTLVRLLLGDWGLYGIVVSQGILYDLEPAGPGLQRVIQKDASFETVDRMLNSLTLSPRLMGMSPTNVLYDVEAGYRTTHGDWYDRVASAFQQMQGSGLWQSVNLDMTLVTIYAAPSITTSNDCGTAVTDYRNWLVNMLAGADSYQLWTSRNLEGSVNGAYTMGCASASDRFHWSKEWASAILEGTNYWGDFYDANSAYERGIVSGHELGHIYGEEDEVSGCRTWGIDCNIMQPDVDNSARSFYWESVSKTEIQCRFYHDKEYPSECA